MLTKVRKFAFVIFLASLFAPRADAAPSFLDPYGKVELGVAFPLRAPQSDYFWPGLGARLNLGLGLGEWFSIQATAQMLALPARSAAPSSDAAVPFGAGGGFRLKLPYRYFASPWIDADVLYVRTGSLNRIGYTVGAGVHFPLGAKKIVRLGPFVRLFQVIDTDAPNINSTDGMVLIVGLSVEAGSPRAAQSEVAMERIPEIVQAPSDRDKDGILDIDDKCPDQSGSQKLGGCPDKDMDGVADADDKCPDQPGSQKLRGCPDKDEDGIADAEDKCPDQRGTETSGGCPDKDGDGIADSRDTCPEQPGPLERQGCPAPRVEVTQKKIEIAEKIYFDTARDEIQERSFPILDDVVRAMKENPKLRVRVEGHTDDQGKAEKNVALSQGRAAAVKTYLIKHGVDAQRIQAKGFGAARPIASNETEPGREQNRRVEFVIVP